MAQLERISQVVRARTRGTVREEVARPASDLLWYSVVTRQYEARGRAGGKTGDGVLVLGTMLGIGRGPEREGSGTGSGNGRRQTLGRGDGTELG